MADRNPDPRLVELLRMFDTYGQTPSPSRLEDYLETIGPCTAAELHQARIDAMRESGRFPPTPGELTAALRAIRRTRPGDAPAPDYSLPALPAPDAEAEQRVLRELSRRIAASGAKRRGELMAFAEHLARVERIERFPRLKSRGSIEATCSSR